MADFAYEMRYLFDRAKPFYPIVMAYLIQLHALKEIPALGVLGSVRAWNLEQLPGTEAEHEELRVSIDKLLSPLSLVTTGDHNRLDIPIDFVAKEFVNNLNYLIGHQILAALNVLVMAHEITKDQPYRVPDERWEFLRHCRNAAAHNGNWYFLNGEPRRPAKWRGIDLDPAMNGQPLLKGPDGNGSLNLGDPIALLWDIEHENPGMHT